MMKHLDKFFECALTQRKAEHEIEDIFLKRWSPRAFSSDKISKEQLLKIFEAGRWAPSTYNEQEWRFLYGTRDTSQWELFFNLLTADNQSWCKNAAALVLIIGSKTLSLNKKNNEFHSFDCGAAFQNMALQATSMNIICHGMAGFDKLKAKSDLNIPDTFSIEAMFALGKPGSIDELPAKLKKLESPSNRRPLPETICEGQFCF